jgi:hypothetical protein
MLQSDPLRPPSDETGWHQHRPYGGGGVFFTTFAILTASGVVAVLDVKEHVHNLLLAISVPDETLKRGEERPV